MKEFGGGFSGLCPGSGCDSRKLRQNDSPGVKGFHTQEGVALCSHLTQIILCVVPREGVSVGRR